MYVRRALTESKTNSAGSTPEKPGSTAHSHLGSLASKQSQSQLALQTGNPQVAETAVLSSRYTGSSGIWAPWNDCGDGRQMKKINKKNET